MKHRCLRLSLLAIPALVLCGCHAPPADEYDELGSKSDYSVLQGLEYEWRGKVIGEPMVVTRGAAEALGVASLDGRATVWVLLRANASPYYKQSIDGNYLIKRALVEKLVTEKRVSATVAAVLWSHTSQP